MRLQDLSTVSELARKRIGLLHEIDAVNRPDHPNFSVSISGISVRDDMLLQVAANAVLDALRLRLSEVHNDLRSLGVEVPE